MKRYLPFLMSAAVFLGGCAVTNGAKPQIAALPAAESRGLPMMPPGQTAATLDQTTAAERAAAVAVPIAGARLLGKTTVALGSPVEQGFWLKSPQVSAPGKGKVVTAAGASVAVDLVPGSGGALLSLAAYRALGLALTDLPEVTVYAE